MDTQNPYQAPETDRAFEDFGISAETDEQIKARAAKERVFVGIMLAVICVMFVASHHVEAGYMVVPASNWFQAWDSVPSLWMSGWLSYIAFITGCVCLWTLRFRVTKLVSLAALLAFVFFLLQAAKVGFI